MAEGGAGPFELPARETGAGPTLVILHGLFGQGRNWDGLARKLADRFRVVAFDLRNHGGAPHGRPMDYRHMAADVAHSMARLGLARAHILGHSMGGKTAMTLALTAPERVARLIVADIAPVAYSHTQMPIAQAMRAVDMGAMRRRGDVEAALRDAVDEPALRLFLMQNVEVAADGLRWRLGLDEIIADMTAIMDFPKIEAAFDGPALFLTGARSDYVRPDHRDVIRRLFPKAGFVVQKDAGHWLHADQPEAVAATVAAWLSRDPG